MGAGGKVWLVPNNEQDRERLDPTHQFKTKLVCGDTLMLVWLCDTYWRDDFDEIRETLTWLDLNNVGWMDCDY